ncbi:MAG: hypothetical protein L0241_30565 [Planctomycetia bacterium]|nr:hypothetical protein [Planctomycetia bacterium]
MSTTKSRWNNLNRRSKEKNITCCTFNEFQEWYDKEPKVCRYCGIEEAFLSKYLEGNKTSLHIDRMQNNKGYIVGNMGLACHACNSTMKGCRTEFFVKVVVTAILKAGMLDEYHLWYVLNEKRKEACYWHQFMRSEVIGSGENLRIRRIMPNDIHYGGLPKPEEPPADQTQE